MNYLKRALTRDEQRALQELMIDVSLFLKETISHEELVAQWHKFTFERNAPLAKLDWDLEEING